MSGIRFRLNWISAPHHNCHVMHHIMNMPDLSHLVIIVASYVCLVICFFADSTDELMRATTSSPTVSRQMFSRRAFPPSATYFSALPLSILLALCYGALVVRSYLCLPCSRYIAYLPHPITMFCLCVLFEPCES